MAEHLVEEIFFERTNFFCNSEPAHAFHTNKPLLLQIIGIPSFTRAKKNLFSFPCLAWMQNFTWFPFFATGLLLVSLLHEPRDVIENIKSFQPEHWIPDDYYSR